MIQAIKQLIYTNFHAEIASKFHNMKFYSKMHSNKLFFI